MPPDTDYFLAGALTIRAAHEPGSPDCIFVGTRAFHGSSRAANLLRAVDAENTLAAITCRFNALDGAQLDTVQIRQILERQLLPAGLVRATREAVDAPQPRGPSVRLFLSFTLLNEHVVRALCPLFAPLFAPRVAAAIGGAAAVLLATWLALALSAGASAASLLSGFPMRLDEAMMFYSLLFACFVLHEFGHAAATHRNGVEPAAIGAGLYLVFPVLFCDVTRAWSLGRMGRVAVNLGGIHLQAIVTACIVPFQWWTGSDVLALLIALNLVSIAMNLNPFFRFDGYWIYSDLAGIPNLRERSRAWLLQRCIDLARQLRGDTMAAKSATVPVALRWYAWGSLVFFTLFSLHLVQQALAYYPALLGMLHALVLPEQHGDIVQYLLLGFYAVAYVFTGIFLLSRLVMAARFVRAALVRRPAPAIGECQ